MKKLTFWNNALIMKFLMALTIGVLTNQIGGALNPYEKDVSRAIKTVARECNFNVVFYSGGFYKSPVAYERQRNFVFDLVNADKPDGLLVVSAMIGELIRADEIHALCRRFAPIPLVSLGVEIRGIPSVLIDNTDSMRQTVTHLIEHHGCRTFVYLDGPAENHEARLRYRSFLSCLEEAGISFDQTLLFPGTFYYMSGMEAARSLYERARMDFDAVVSANDEMAAGFMEYMSSRGIRCPRDYRITGFDNHPSAPLASPPLTTIEQNTYELAYLAAKRLYTLLSGEKIPDVSYLPTKFIIRSSCGCSPLYNAETEGGIRPEDTVRELDRTRSRLRVLEDRHVRMQKEILAIERQEAVLTVISEALISASSLEDLRSIFDTALPRLPLIGKVSLCVFAGTVSHGSSFRPVLTYSRGTGAYMDSRTEAFSGSGSVPGESARFRVVEALSWQDEILGILVFDVDDIFFSFFSTIREQISNSLYSIKSFSYIQELNAELEQKVERLSSLRTIDLAIIESPTREQLLHVLVQQIKWRQRVDAVSISLVQSRAETLLHAASIGFAHSVPESLRQKIDYRIELSGNQSHPDQAVADMMEREGFRFCVAVPLIIHDVYKGLLEVFRHDSAPANEDWHLFLDTLAGQAAIAIENVSLINDLRTANHDLVDAYNATIEGWSRALDLRDRETEGHCMRVAHLTVEMGKRLALDPETLENLYRGALLHDIGKVGIPDSILLKNGPLSPEERETMCRHPQYAHDLLSPIRFLGPALAIPWCHHEKWDGTGYPRGLAGKAIPLAARIFAIIDVWDALLSERPYRKPWTGDAVCSHIKSLAGTHFDPELTEIFLSMVGSRSVPGMIE